MTLSEILSILPLIIPSVAIVVLMLLIAFVRNHFLTVALTLISLSASLIAVLVCYKQQPQQITQLLVMDGYACFYIGLIYATTMFICALSYGYIKHQKIVREEYYLFLLTTALGCAVLVSSSHFASLFIGLELLSLSLYVLISYTGTKLKVEAGIKYFVMTAVSVAFLLFGMSLTYAASGSLKFPEISKFTLDSTMVNSYLYLAGTGMVLVGICFKLALVPFHFWIADVFEGASAPVAGFLGTVSKGAVFAALMRYFFSIDILSHDSLYFILAAVAVASMFFGNLAALLQKNLKRVLAYSSVAHFGYLLVILIAGSYVGIFAAAFYLTAYFITMLTAFGVITFLSKEQRDLDAIEDYQGLVFTHPFHATLLTVALLSLTGIPLTAGFIAKFYLITAGANAKLWALLIILIINSVIGLFYYLRIIISLFAESSRENTTENGGMLLGPSFSWIGAFGLVTLLFFLIYLGIAPGPFVHLIQTLTNI
jgi:NADH-quinone oxidoreductase subunit N